MAKSNVVKLPPAEPMTAEQAESFFLGGEPIPEPVVRLLVADMQRWLDDKRRPALKAVAVLKKQLSEQEQNAKSPMQRYAVEMLKKQIAEQEQALTKAVPSQDEDEVEDA